jgi:hypothetical protein
MQWRYVRLVEEADGWELRPSIDGYETKLRELNEAGDDCEGDALSELLEALGSAGWELVQVERLADGEHWYAQYYFKRQIGLGPTIAYSG